MNWIFINGDYFQTDNTGQKARITFSQKRSFTGEVDEHVLILEQTKNDWEFSAHYRIANIEVINPEAELKEIVITLTLVNIFEEKKLLEDYIYSLRRITNYASPMKHFRRKYSRLYYAEFEAIVEDRIYVKRTLLGTVLNAMHADHQRAFIAYSANEAPELLVGNTDMDTSLTLLLQYLDFAVVKPAIYLIQSAEMMKSFIPEDEISTIGFSFDAENVTSKNTQFIHPQVTLIDEYLEYLFDFINEISNLLDQELGKSPEFDKLFKNTPLPITLK